MADTESDLSSGENNSLGIVEKKTFLGLAAEQLSIAIRCRIGGHFAEES